MSDQIITIDRGDERRVTIRVGDREVAQTHYDEMGWAGLDVLETTVRRLGEALGVPVQEV